MNGDIRISTLFGQSVRNTLYSNTIITYLHPIRCDCRPDDVITSVTGETIEVVHTDAEVRTHHDASVEVTQRE